MPFSIITKVSDISHDLPSWKLTPSGGVVINLSLRPRYGSNDPATYAGEMGIVEDEPVSWEPQSPEGLVRGGRKKKRTLNGWEPKNCIFLQT